MLEEEIKKKFRMQGLLVADINIVKMMDIKLENNLNSDIVPISLKADGTINNKNSSTISETDFSNLYKHVKKIIREISREILNGNIDIKPYNYKNKTGCDYCSYKTICMFDTSLKNNKYNYIYY